MRIFLAILSGFVLTLTVFVGGGLTAIYFVNAEPMDAHPLDMSTSALWSSKAVSVNTDRQDLDRLPARPALSQPIDIAQVSSEPEEPAGENQIDMMTTAALPAEDPSQPKSAIQPAMSADHVQWCSNHYRSYDKSDNHYTAYSGARRECISPFSEDAAGTAELETMNASADDSSALITAANAGEMPGVNLDSQHIQSCFARYRSYRPEDNTYQPYGGGPRKQCE